MAHSGLIQQGYKSFTPSELNNISNGLRFTPLVCMLLAIYGLYLQNPYWHFGIAALGIIPFWFPSSHPFDVFYNKVFRHLVGGVSLPSNPLPRRIACFMGGLMNVGIGLSFYFGNVPAAYVFGAILIVLQLIVITTHFCVASWMYEGFMKLTGNWDNYISKEEAQQLIAEGAILVDVRNPNEFNAGHIKDAINIPVSNIANDERLKNTPAVLYCRSGMRCIEAKKKLAKIGNEKIYNLGSMKKWEQ